MEEIPIKLKNLDTTSKEAERGIFLFQPAEHQRPNKNKRTQVLQREKDYH
jgi:hypothetical protein